MKSITSGIPDWLKNWRKTGREIIAQYRYFDVYEKAFPKGKITLPGGDIKKNKVAENYFVLVAGKEKMNYAPEITSKMLPEAMTGTLYHIQISSIYGKGTITWKMISGDLPEGIKLNAEGTLDGTPAPGTAGTWYFKVSATDSEGKADEKTVDFKVSE